MTLRRGGELDMTVSGMRAPLECAEPLLRLDKLTVDVSTSRNSVRLVEGIDLTVNAGERVALVGESGSGKSVTAKAIMRLDPTVAISGSVRYNGVELTALSDADMRSYRGARIGMVFQDPLRALNPVLTIGTQVSEPLRIRGVARKVAEAKAVALLDRLGVADASRRMRAYPHEFSGGMRQRVGLAMALIAEPDLLIADEPTTALDPRVKRQVVDLLDEISRERGLALLLVTHDMGMVAQVADRVTVMYCGRKVDDSTVYEIFAGGRHPYTEGLLAAVPRIDRPAERLTTVSGTPATPQTRPAGCAFHPRCALTLDVCTSDVPELVPFGTGVMACHVRQSSASQDSRGTDAAS